MPMLPIHPLPPARPPSRRSTNPTVDTPLTIPSLQIETRTGGQITSLLRELASLRTRVFREWPYLYDGDENLRIRISEVLCAQRTRHAGRGV